MHTALHGFLRQICLHLEIDCLENESITAVFRRLRQSDALASSRLGNGDEIARMVGGMSTIVDALNTVRNRESLAHPNESRIGDDEAVLVIDATRAVFRYLERKLNSDWLA
jgi:hypothetical protein